MIIFFEGELLELITFLNSITVTDVHVYGVFTWVWSGVLQGAVR